MRNIFRRSNNVAPVSNVGLMFYCERVTATATSPQHIRVITDEDPVKTGGGINGPALCGADIARGWDRREATLENIKQYYDYGVANPDHLPGRICKACAESTSAL